MSLILAYKNRTETMSVCMERIRNELNISSDIPMTYAGRLDPMAEGLVVFLSGDMRFAKEQMLKMDKTYRVEFFLGYETDTYDVLGMVNQSLEQSNHEITIQLIESFQPIGTFTQNFPAYSSRKVDGKPLFVHAKESDTVPTESHNVTIYNYSDFKQTETNSEQLLESIFSDIKKVSGDFRQGESIESWKKVSSSFSETITMYEIGLSVSSGFYIRQWVSDFGTFLSTGAVTFRIVRDTIGVFTMSMLNGESYRVFNDHDQLIQNLTK
jgi:tRNA pseudouridine(55) synthase